MYFTIISQCEKLLPTEKKYILDNILRMSRDLTFLNEIDLNKVEFYWDPNMNDKNGILGAFSLFHSNCIFIRTNKGVMDLMLTTVIHELTHMHQFKTNPLLYIVCSIPVIREVTIESQARSNEALAELIVNEQKLIHYNRENGFK